MKMTKDSVELQYITFYYRLEATHIIYRVYKISPVTPRHNLSRLRYLINWTPSPYYHIGLLFEIFMVLKYFAPPPKYGSGVYGGNFHVLNRKPYLVKYFWNDPPS